MLSGLVRARAWMLVLACLGCDGGDRDDGEDGTAARDARAGDGGEPSGPAVALRERPEAPGLEILSGRPPVVFAIDGADEAAGALFRLAPSDIEPQALSGPVPAAVAPAIGGVTFYEAADELLYAVELAAGDAEAISDAPIAQYWASNDGRVVAYSDRLGTYDEVNLFVVQLDGDRTPRPSAVGPQFRLSADGSRAAWVKGEDCRNLVTWSLDDTDPRELVSDDCQSGLVIEDFDPATSSVLYHYSTAQTPDRVLATSDLRSGNKSIVSTHFDSTLTAAAWDPFGQYVAYKASGAIWTSAPDGAHAHRWTSAHEQARFQPSPDGTKLFVIERDAQIVDLLGQSVAAVAGETSRVSEAKWSGRSTFVAFKAEPESVVISRADGAVLQTLDGLGNLDRYDFAWVGPGLLAVERTDEFFKHALTLIDLDRDEVRMLPKRRIAGRSAHASAFCTLEIMGGEIEENPDVESPDRLVPGSGTQVLRLHWSEGEGGSWQERVLDSRPIGPEANCLL